MAGVLLQVSGPVQAGSCKVLCVLAVAEDMPGLQCESQQCEGPRCGFWNCPDNVPSLGLSDCVHLQIS